MSDWDWPARIHKPRSWSHWFYKRIAARQHEAKSRQSLRDWEEAFAKEYYGSFPSPFVATSHVN